MRLNKALRVDNHTRMAIVGSGGKTTALFTLARQMNKPVLVACSTHLWINQARFADQHVVINDRNEWDKIHQIDPSSGKIFLFTGPPGKDGRLSGVDEFSLEKIDQFAKDLNLPCLVEADGSRGLPLKAPAAHEPAIPSWVNTVLVVVGLSGIGKPLDQFSVHRPAIFSDLSAIKPGEEITAEGLVRVLLHPNGGLKNIPCNARKMVLLNQADTDLLKSYGYRIADALQKNFDSSIVGSLMQADDDEQVYSVVEPIAGVILAAGGSSRMGKQKVTLAWRGKPIIHKVIESALSAGLCKVVVVTGYLHEVVEDSLASLPATIVYNASWATGQSTSVKTGLAKIPHRCGAVVMLLADQPLVGPFLINSLISAHRTSLSPIIYPFVFGKRTNPVLFDRITFADLLNLEGDIGGRAIFPKYQCEGQFWLDEKVIQDIDTITDYQNLISGENF